MGFVKYVQASLDYLLELNLTNQEEPIEEVIIEEETTEPVENVDHFSGLADIQKRNSSSSTSLGGANFTRQRKFTQISEKKEKYAMAVSDFLIEEEEEEENVQISTAIRREDLLFD